MSLSIPLDQLPEDVLREMSHYMGLSHLHDLSSLRLTCRTLAETLSPYAFAHVILRSVLRAQALVDLCLSNDSLLSGTQKLTIGNPEQQAHAPSVTLWEWLATSEGMQLLKGLGRVPEVCVCQFSPRYPARLKTTPHKAFISVMLRIGKFDRLRYLTIQWSELIAPDTKMILVSVISSHMESLVFDNSGLDILTARRAPVMLERLSNSELNHLPPSQLQSLTITGSGESHNIIQALITSCRLVSLSILKITWSARFQQEVLSTLLGHVASSLRNLTVDIRPGLQTYHIAARASLVRLETLELIEKYDSTPSGIYQSCWREICSGFTSLLPKARQIDRMTFQIVLPEIAWSEVVPFLQSHAFLDKLAMSAREIHVTLVLATSPSFPVMPEMWDEWLSTLLATNAASGTISRCTILIPSTNTEISWSPNTHRIGE